MHNVVVVIDVDVVVASALVGAYLVLPEPGFIEISKGKWEKRPDSQTRALPPGTARRR